MKIEYQWVESFLDQIRIHRLRRLRKLQIRNLQYKMWRMTEMGSSLLELIRMVEKHQMNRWFKLEWLRKMMSQQKCMMSKISIQPINISILPWSIAQRLFRTKNASSFLTKRGPSHTWTFTTSFHSNSILLWRVTVRSNTFATVWSTNSLIPSKEVKKTKSF